MTLIDNIIVNVLHIIVPFLGYLFYIVYKKNVDDRENEVVMIFATFTTLYFVLKYNHQLFVAVPMFLVNIPLLASYIKKNNIAIVMSSVIAIVYYYHFYNTCLFFIIGIYILFYILYKTMLNKINIQYFLAIFTGILGLSLTIIGLFAFDNNSIDYYLEILFVSLLFLVISWILIYIFETIEDVVKIKVSAKEIERDKQVKTTLFHITHEIKNPIAVCKGYLDMMNPKNLKQTTKYIPIIKEEIDKTLILLEDFLSMNKVKLNKDLLDINYLLSDFVKNYEPYFKENNIITDIKLTDYEVYINGDYNKLYQVFLNIFKNSIEALGKNPKIKVWTEIKNNKFYIYILDNGEGIPKDILKKMGEPFFTTKRNGTGLGVSLSRGIIEAHDGKLKYESELGEYTKTIVILPILEWY